ncbi:MAG: putative transporter, ATP-binding protein, partial [Frankiales bacterium]|nr:putative transporter, ATP-binding protein [Frankiales bacterium]
FHGVRAASRLGVSYLREGRALFSQLTVRENLRLRTHSRKKADALLPQYPILEPLADRRAGLLSGGEQQVLALACALSVNPRLLLIDEMTMGLAPIMVTQLVALIRKAAVETGVAVLFVEQHVHAALDLADRAYVLRHGELVMEGPADDLRSRLGELHDSYFDLAT